MFTSTPILRDLERLMQQIPNFAPRGYGVMVLCEHDYSVKDCDCAYCSFHTGSLHKGANPSRCSYTERSPY